MTERGVQQQAEKCEDLHAQRAEGVRAMLSARKTWRQHLGDKLERVCPGQVQPDDRHRREGKLSQSEIDRMVQEAKKYRDEDEVNESKLRDREWCRENSALLCATPSQKETRGRSSKMMTDTKAV